MFCTLVRQLKRLLYLLLLLNLVGHASAQSRLFKAEFRSVVNGEKVMYAKLTNQLGDSRLTNLDGYVEMPFKKGDRIAVSHLSYDSVFIDPGSYDPGDTILFYMTPRVFHLQEFTFSVLGPRYAFDSKFAKTDLGATEAERIKAQLEIKQLRPDLVALDRSAADGVRLGSPITALYEQFSKAGRERRRYAELLARERQDSITRNKYSVPLVSSLIGSNSKAETLEFMKFCSFDQRYIEQSSQVDIFFEILRCKEEYQALED